jgi:nucleotide-binding universal stress UspA family protein
MKVLMGIDNSKFSKDVIQAVVTQYRPENTEVLVLHVLEPISLLAPPEMAQGYAPELEEQKEPAHALVEGIAKELRESGFKAHTAVKIGDVRVSILDAATAWHADLILVGSHGQRGIESFLLGSVAEFVARHAKCSVEVVRRPVGI